jgi:hypothetical protein
MNKREILEKIRSREEDKKKSFVEFAHAEKFNEGVDKVGNFSKDMPVYYRQISENKFLAFNIPFYGKEKNASFQTDFWEITALSENEFLNNKLLDENLKTVLLGFDLEEDIELYKSQEEETTLE